MTVNPYVGPRAFRLGEKLPGREREMRELADLLIAERIVLLHSPSGAGKTSLLQAGVTPLLRTEQLGEGGFKPTVALRVRTPSPPGRTVHNRYVYSIALGLLRDRDPQDLERLTLQEVLELAERTLEGGFRVLLLDQFEEILTLNPADPGSQTVFFQELGAVLADRPIWALFSMREDYIGGLDRFVDYLPGYLRTTYRLDFLTPAEALAAATVPAKAQSVVLELDAADLLIEKLARTKVDSPGQGAIWLRTPYIDPFRLQVACRRLWNQVRATRGVDFSSINLDDVETLNVDQALTRYCSDSIAGVERRTGVAQGVIREWFETQLITDRHLRSQALTGPMSEEADPGEIMLALQDTYLVHSDTRGRSTWYELTHDRLIEPVLESNREWRSMRLKQERGDAKRRRRPLALLLLTALVELMVILILLNFLLQGD